MNEKDPQPYQYEEETTDLGHLPLDYSPPTNDTALISLLTGVGGWAILGGGIVFLSTLSACCVPIAWASWAVSLITARTSKAQMAASDEQGHDLAQWGQILSLAGLAITVLGLLFIVAALLLGVISLGALSFMQ